MKKFARLFVALMMVCIMTIGVAAAEITVGIVNNPPSESGYREANVKDFEKVFTAENGYEAKTFYSLKNDEQLNAALPGAAAGTLITSPGYAVMKQKDLDDSWASL